MLPGVAFVEIKTAPEIVPNVNRLADAMRAAGGTVVWIVTTYTDDVSLDSSTYYWLSTPENGQRRSNALIKGTEGHRIWKHLNVLDGAPVIERRDSRRSSKARARWTPTCRNTGWTRSSSLAA
jgi:ureidoacrylate peracid hydrolase